jgi:hypothetical protein
MLKFQKQTVRIILDKAADALSDPIFKELRWLQKGYPNVQIIT